MLLHGGMVASWVADMQLGRDNRVAVAGRGRKLGKIWVSGGRH